MTQQQRDSVPDTFQHPGQKNTEPQKVIHSPCGAPILIATVWGGTVKVQPQPITTQQEIVHRHHGRHIYQSLNLGFTWQLQPRSLIYIQHSNPTHVFVEHTCDQPRQPHTSLWPDTARKDADQCPY